jgi:hypothetical protein
MLVVSDVVDVVIPLPEDLLVNLQESRQSIGMYIWLYIYNIYIYIYIYIYILYYMIY